jgi:hypothetical protein
MKPNTTHTGTAKTSAFVQVASPASVRMPAMTTPTSSHAATYDSSLRTSAVSDACRPGISS